MKNKLNRNNLVSKPLILVLVLILFQSLTTMANSQGVQDQSYQVLVNGKSVTLYQAHVWQPTYNVPSFGGPYWFCSFDLIGDAKLEVTSARPLDHLEILPESRGVKASVTGNKAVMIINKPVQLAFEPDHKNGPLLIFANPQEVNPLKKGDPNVIYYGPGEHDAGPIELKDNQTLYLAEGAIVKGGIHAKGSNIIIRGRGILDCYSYPRGHGPTSNPVSLEECQNITVEGIVIKDSWSWTFVSRNCDGVFVDNVKLLSPRVENGDGFDISNSRNVTIMNTFVRTDDDCIALKGTDRIGRKPVENIRVENTILWTDRAHIWRIGCESSAEAMRNLVFKNLDILHFIDFWSNDEVPFCLSLEPAEDMPVENLLFEDIRIRTEGQQGFMDIRPKVTKWARTPTPGSINNVIFRNVAFSGPAGIHPGLIRISGPDPVHSVTNILFENVTRNGILVTNKSSEVKMIGSVHNISFTSGKKKDEVPGNNMSQVVIKSAPKGLYLIMVEAGRPRLSIYTRGGVSSPLKPAVERLQRGLIIAINTDVPMSDVAIPEIQQHYGIIIGDCPEAEAIGLNSTRLPLGGFEIKTSDKCAFIVGNGTGLERGIDTFLEYFLGYKEGEQVTPKTDLIVPQSWIVSSSASN